MPADLREVNQEEGWRLKLLILAQTIKQPVLFYENLTLFDSRLKKKNGDRFNWPGYSAWDLAGF